MAKGDVLSAARIAGIQGAKKTSPNLFLSVITFPSIRLISGLSPMRKKVLSK